MSDNPYVQFLRDNGKARADAPDDEAHWCETMRNAADEMERLRNSNDDMTAALKLALEYWSHRQQRYKNRHPAWVQAANAAARYGISTSAIRRVQYGVSYKSVT